MIQLPLRFEDLYLLLIKETPFITYDDEDVPALFYCRKLRLAHRGEGRTARDIEDVKKLAETSSQVHFIVSTIGKAKNLFDRFYLENRSSCTELSYTCLRLKYLDCYIYFRSILQSCKGIQGNFSLVFEHSWNNLGKYNKVVYRRNMRTYAELMWRKRVNDSSN